jgi:hypothetical protein
MRMDAMDMSSMQSGGAPPDSRDPDAYAEGYEYTDMPGMEQSDRIAFGVEGLAPYWNPMFTARPSRIEVLGPESAMSNSEYGCATRSAGSSRPTSVTCGSDSLPGPPTGGVETENPLPSVASWPACVGGSRPDLERSAMGIARRSLSGRFQAGFHILPQYKRAHPLGPP